MKTLGLQLKTRGCLRAKRYLIEMDWKCEYVCSGATFPEVNDRVGLPEFATKSISKKFHIVLGRLWTCEQSQK